MLLDDLSNEQMYNADESGLFGKCLTTRAVAFESEHHAAGQKSSKKRVTILPCSNAMSNPKLKPLVNLKNQVF